MEMVPSNADIYEDNVNEILANIDFSDTSTSDLLPELAYDIPEIYPNLHISTTAPSLSSVIAHDLPKANDIPETDPSLHIPTTALSLSVMDHDLPKANDILETDPSLHIPTTAPSPSSVMAHDLPKANDILETDLSLHIPTTAPSLSSVMAHDANEILANIDFSDTSTSDLSLELAYDILETDPNLHIPTTAPSLSSIMAHDLPKANDIQETDLSLHIPTMTPSLSSVMAHGADEILARIDFSDTSTSDLSPELAYDIPETDPNLHIPTTAPSLSSVMAHDLPKANDIPETDPSLHIPTTAPSLSSVMAHDADEILVSFDFSDMSTSDLPPKLAYDIPETDPSPHIPTTAPSLSSVMAHNLPKTNGCVHIPTVVAPEFSTKPPEYSHPKYNEGFWSIPEHCRFLEGLRKYGKGDWMSIAELVGTRSHTQVASHAQKFELHQSNKEDNNDNGKRKRPSIYDITIADLEPEPDNNNQLCCGHQQINIVASSSLPMPIASQFRPCPRNLWNLRLGDADNEDLFSVYASAIGLNQRPQDQNSQKSVSSSAPTLPAAPHHHQFQYVPQNLGFGHPANYEYLSSSNMSAVSNLNQRPQEECYQQSVASSSSSRPPTLPAAPYQFQYGQQTPWNNQSLGSGLPINESLSDLGTVANMNQVPQEHYYQQIFTSSSPPPPYQFQPAGAGLQSLWNKQPLQVRCPSNEYLSGPQSQCCFHQSVPAVIPMPAHCQAHQAAHHHYQRPQDQHSVTSSSCSPTTLPASSQFQPGEQNLWNNLDARYQSPHYYQLRLPAAIPMPPLHQPPATHHDDYCKRRRML